jgi:hypothetical protein
MDLGDVRGDVYDIFMGNEECPSLGGEDHRIEENKGCFDFNKLQFYAYADIYYYFCSSRGAVAISEH